MELRRLAPGVGIAGCLATVGAVIAPFVLLSDAGTGLSVYYGSGPFGVGAVAFLATLLVIVFLSGLQERTDPATVAGVAVVAGVALVGFTLLWALAVDTENVLSFPAAWMGYHRWLVVGTASVVAVAALVYARIVVR